MPVPVLNLQAPGFMWQARFELFLTSFDADDRTVHFIWDPNGNVGKTRFVRYMVARHKAMYASVDNFQAAACMWRGQKICLS